MENLKLALIQYPIFWEDKEKNFKYLDNKLDENPESVDIIILPEMFNTGFTMNSEKFSENMNGESIQKLIQWSIKYNACVCASLIIKEDTKYYNRLIWVDKNQKISHYDKKHLFGLGSEDKNFSAGNNIIIVQEKGWKICPMICYDLRFPVWTRNADAKYDVLLFIANWPDLRIEHWNALIPARAIENQSFVVGLNRIGNDINNIEHSGFSKVVDPNGNILKESTKEEILIVELEKNILIKNRRLFPFLKDMDQFIIK